MNSTDKFIFDEDDVVVTHEKSYAAGVPAVLVSLKRGVEQMGVVRTARTLARLNQRAGFDCPGCAWPETPGHRKHAEFCENGAKAVAEEATTRRVGPESSPPMRLQNCWSTRIIGSASRVGSLIRWCFGQARRITSRSSGMRRSR
jgi:hypothetical protein